MEKVTLSILTLFALYILYSECIKLPPIIKKNKTLFYALIIGSYLYCHQNIEGYEEYIPTWFMWVLEPVSLVMIILGFIWLYVLIDEPDQDFLSNMCKFLFGLYLVVGGILMLGLNSIRLLERLAPHIISGNLKRVFGGVLKTKIH